MTWQEKKDVKKKYVNKYVRIEFNLLFVINFILGLV